jgi:biopolymer transport protein ExbB
MRVGVFVLAAGCSFQHGNAQVTVDGPPDVTIDTPQSTATRVLLTIHNSLRGESFDDFAVLVALDSTRIDYSLTAPGGADLRFYASDDATPLAYEIDTWDPAGRSAAWVLVPTIPAFTDMNIWMHYGDPTASSQSNPNAVWSASHVVVWHLEGDPSAGVVDSTANAHVGVASTGIDASRLVTGVIGNALEFHSTASECVLAPVSTQFTLPTYTWQEWLNGDAAPMLITTGSNEDTISNGDVAFNFGWDHYGSGYVAAAAQRDMTAWQSQTVGPSNIVAQTWYLVTATYDGSQLCSYLDGAAKGCVAVGTPLPPNGSLSVGGPNAGAGCLPGTFPGRIDEVRVENVARTQARIQAEYQSQADLPASPFVTFGTPEKLP